MVHALQCCVPQLSLSGSVAASSSIFVTGTAYLPHCRPMYVHDSGHALLHGSQAKQSTQLVTLGECYKTVSSEGAHDGGWQLSACPEWRRQPPAGQKPRRICPASCARIVRPHMRPSSLQRHCAAAPLAGKAFLHQASP